MNTITLFTPFIIIGLCLYGCRGSAAVLSSTSHLKYSKGENWDGRKRWEVRERYFFGLSPY